jgi:hypothetical protein
MNYPGNMVAIRLGKMVDNRHYFIRMTTT